MSAWRVAALAADDSRGFRQLAMADIPGRRRFSFFQMKGRPS